MSDEARLRALVDQHTNRLWNHLGIVVDAVGEGFVRLRLPMQAVFGTYRREDVMHGGVVASLIDSGGERGADAAVCRRAGVDRDGFHGSQCLVPRRGDERPHGRSTGAARRPTNGMGAGRRA